MIYDNPTSESFTKFRDMIRKSTEEKYLKPQKNSKKGGYSNKYSHPRSMLNRPRSLIGASTMGSPVKLAPDEINKLNNYSDKVKMSASSNPHTAALQQMKPIILPIDKMTLNKIGLGINGKSGKNTTKKSVPKSKSRKGSSRSINLDNAENITRMVLNINIAKRKLIFEFDIDRNRDEDGMVEEESHHNHANHFDDGQKMRLEVTFNNVKEMDIFSDTNSL